MLCDGLSDQNANGLLCSFIIILERGEIINRGEKNRFTTENTEKRNLGQKENLFTAERRRFTCRGGSVGQGV